MCWVACDDYASRDVVTNSVARRRAIGHGVYSADSALGGDDHVRMLRRYNFA